MASFGGVTSSGRFREELKEAAVGIVKVEVTARFQVVRDDREVTDGANREEELV